ncbi:MAG: autotransporter outer membrane beta-barrel domain-containing protein [Betaproteobacteria bacterium]|nr:autotransporter outer membrane beta-barrel domain-containing protein [Betaproteobacteria bacterium]
MIHEFGHALGIMGWHDVINRDDKGVGTKAIFNANRFTAWNAHLRDVFGKQARPDMMIEMNVMTGAPGENQAGVFQIFDQDGNAADYKYPTFHGKNVDALTGGMGMPVMGGFSNAGNAMDGANSLGHPGITQSAMSYGIIRNMGFTEMELAAFQDMGYDIDRSQFFGKSYYHAVGGDNQVNNAFFGTADKPNTAILGLGVHVLRDNLTLTQAADIYANGYGGGGVRIDGVNNALAIPRGVTVAANGPFGTGLLVAYGNANTIRLDGKVEAVGPGGIGAHFGIQAAGSKGLVTSYMRDPSSHIVSFSDLSIQNQYEYLKAYQDLQGPLVEEFAISGRLAGQLAAIRIEDDVHVGKIAVQSGAVIAGDIASEWDRKTSGGDFATTISFGQTGSGGAMRMDGDIIWNNDALAAENSLDIRQLGGHLSYNGEANVYAWQIDPGASLGGNSAITIDGPDPFLNAGQISPGNSIGIIIINGDYRQSASGNLLMEFTPTATDQFIVTGAATIDPGASLSLQALPAFYATGSQRALTNTELFDNSLSTGDFILDLLPVASPTLIASWDNSGINPVFNVTRAANAYSQYASGATGTSVGGALFGIAAQQVTGDMQNLFAAIDFSSPDGAGVRSALRQLAPTAYDNTAQTALYTGYALSGLLLEQIARIRPHQQEIAFSPEMPAGSAFILPAGGYFGQNRWGDNQGFDASFAGLIGGMNRYFEKGLVGIHAAVLHRETRNRSEGRVYSQANGVNFGAHGILYPHEGFFISGLMNAGLEKTRMTRNVKIDDYQRQSSSSYTAFTARSALRGGYEWQAGNIYFGPLAGLEYGFYHRPSVSETGGQATRLQLDAASFHSLRFALGGQTRTQMQLKNHVTLDTGLSAQWIHDVLNARHGSTAFFTGYSENRFSVTNRTDARSALALNAFLTLTTNNRLSVNVYAGTELFRGGSSSVQGGLAIGWKF